MKRRSALVALTAAAIVVGAGLFYLRPLLPAEWVGRDPGRTPRPPEWAAPLNAPGLSNFHKVTDDLYRGAQPDAEGMRQLKAMGIKTVVNLRSFHSDRREIGETGLAYEHIYMKPWHPEDEDVVRFLQIVTDADRTPVFVHCQRGADRTGFMCAIYRMAVGGWNRQQAIEEMTDGGFGFANSWRGLLKYLRNVAG